ncbi:TPA: IS5/IS1182 family transposase, partial [Klebsiella pneumoniae]
MRGVDVFSEQLFTVKRLEEFIPASHPLRPVREMVNEALRRLDGLFERMYEPSYKGGRPSIAPEKLARAMLLQVFYSIR